MGRSTHRLPAVVVVVLLVAVLVALEAGEVVLTVALGHEAALLLWGQERGTGLARRRLAAGEREGMREGDGDSPLAVAPSLPAAPASLSDSGSESSA